MNQLPAEVFILRHRWTIRWRKPAKGHGADGLCYCDKKVIYINPRLDPKRLVDVITHEISHAVTDELDELHAATTGKVVSELLSSIGAIC